MKSNIQKVYSKLPKQELTAQKVELGLVDDLKKLSVVSDKIVSNINKDSNDLSKLFQELRDLSDDFNSINDRRNDDIKKGKATLKEINNILDKTQQQAKELGVSPKDIPNFIKTQKSSEELRSSVNDMQKYSNIKF
jgi:methyl-accepting chemotaxis protein